MIRNILATAAIGLCLVGAASASTVVNGSFEIGTEGLISPSWTIYPGGLPGWTTTAGGIEVQTAGTLGLTPYNGAHYIELDGTANYTISQTVSLAAGSYYLSFAYSPRKDDSATNGVTYGVAGLLAGAITGPGPSPLTMVGAWTLVKSMFTVTTAGSYTLTLAGAGTQDTLGGFVDAVDISAVPVPAGGLLLLSAVGGIAGLRRRKAR